MSLMNINANRLVSDNLVDVVVGQLVHFKR